MEGLENILKVRFCLFDENVVLVFTFLSLQYREFFHESSLKDDRVARIKCIATVVAKAALDCD